MTDALLAARVAAFAAPAALSTTQDVVRIVRPALGMGADAGVVVPDASVYSRLARKAEFYGVHLAPGRFPGPSVLAEKLPLWMGRVSPPRLPTTPQERLGTLGIADVLAVHTRLVLAFAQKAASDAE